MQDLIRLLEPFMSIIFGNILQKNLKERSLKLSSEILQQIRRILVLISLSFAALVLFCISVGYFIDRTLSLLDQGSFFLTPSLIFLLVFMLVCLGVFAYSTRRKAWAEAFKKDQMDEVLANAENEEKISAHRETSPIETAVSLFILDFVKEREFQREHKKEHKTEHKKDHKSDPINSDHSDKN
jgi:small-conductance mechanosensitive channel